MEITVVIKLKWNVKKLCIEEKTPRIRKPLGFMVWC